jgi:zinc transport system substrate-binding protein
MIVMISHSGSMLHGDHPARTRRWAATLVAATLVAAALLAGCGSTQPGRTTDGKILVVAAFYPLQFLAEQIGGAQVSVVNLVKPGAEPHDLELNPKQTAQIADAGLVIYLRSFQPAVDQAVEQNAKDRALDASTTVQLLSAGPGGNDTSSKSGNGTKSGNDPHVWLDPDRYAAIADRVAERLATIEPGHAADFRGRAATVHARLVELSAGYANGLRGCQRHDIVTSHAAFGYLAARYGLSQIAITGLTPEAEPDPRWLAQVAELARQRHVTTIFFETLVSPKVAQTLATEIGAKPEVLDPIEGIESGSTANYFTIMRDNLGKIRTALGCS